MRLVLNADDPLVADLGRDRAGVTFFGVQDDSVALAGMAHASDSKHCRRCGAPYVYDAVYMGHLGRYRCPNGDGPRPEPDVWAATSSSTARAARSFTLHLGASHDVALPLPGLYNVYNALAAAALNDALGAASRRRGRASGDGGGVRPRGDRADRGPGARDPAREEPGGRQRGAADARAGPGRARRLRRAQRPHRRRPRRLVDLGCRLRAHRRPPAAGRVQRHARRRARRAAEVRGRAARSAGGRAGLADGLDVALAGGEGRLVALPTYTAMLDLRALLVARGAAEGSFR